MLTVGLLRFSCLFTVDETLTLLRFAGWPYSRATVARLGREYLVRWSLWVEKALPPHLRARPVWVLQADGTVEAAGVTTFRAREAITGVTLLARQLEAESRGEVERFLQEVHDLYGVPQGYLRDLSTKLRDAGEAVFPGVPQQEDHWHALDDVMPKALVDYEPLKEALTGDKGLSSLAKRARGLPLRGKGLEELERVGVRLALEWVEEARVHPGGFPWRLPYLEVARRLRWVRGWAGTMISGNLRRGVFVKEVVTLQEDATRLLDREGVRLHLGRAETEARLTEELRRVMRAERGRRSRTPLGPATLQDVEEVEREIAEAIRRFRQFGDWAVPLANDVEKFFREHERYLWAFAEVEGFPRTTVDLERAHGEERRRIRRRTGLEDTGEEMNRVGALLAMVSNQRNPWFLETVLAGVNLAEEFARQDAREVRERLRKLPEEGRRPKVRVPQGKHPKFLGELRDMVLSEGPLEGKLEAWAHSVKADQSEGVGGQ
jgi:hypothetical protein